MKKLFISLTLSCLLGITAALCQTEAGDRMIGGNGTLHISTGGDEELPTFVALTPRLGFFAVNNLAVGAGVPVVYSSQDNSSNTTLGISPFIRGYFGSSATRFLLEGRVGYIYSHFKNKDFDIDESEDFINYGIGAGVAQFLNEHVALEFVLSYDKADSEDFLLDYRYFNGINFNIGLQIHLTRD